MILNRELSGCKTVLSVGCGPGVHEKLLKKLHSDLQIICLDPSKEMLTEGRELSIKSTVKNIFQGIAEGLPFKNNVFDCVYFITSFEFIEDSISALKECSRVLRPYGKAIFLISNFKSWYFQKEHTEAGSYIEGKIKHLDNVKLNRSIGGIFQIISVNYELGIRGENVFETKNPQWASLVVITSIKQGVA